MTIPRNPGRARKMGLGLALAVVAVALPAAEPVVDPVEPRLGLTLEAGALPLLAEALTVAAPQAPLRLRVTVAWKDVEREAGVHDWSAVRTGLDAVGAGERTRVTLCLTGAHPLHVAAGRRPSPLEEGSLEAWLAFVRSAARELGGRVDVYEIWDGPAAPGVAGDPPYEPGVYAFLLKQSALALRAEATRAGVPVRVAQGALDAGRLDWQRKLWEADAAAYIDVLPVRFEVGEDPRAQDAEIAEVFAESLLHPPAAAVWVYLEPAAGSGLGASLPAAAAALAAGAAGAAVALPSDAADRARAAAWVRGVELVLARGFAPAPTSPMELRDVEGRPLVGARISGHFFNDRDFSTLVFYDAGPGRGGREEARLWVEGRVVRDGRSYDPLDSRELRMSSLPLDEREGWRSIRAPLRDYPMLLMFRKLVGMPGLELPPEKLEVESRRGLTAEEIIARHQEVQKLQDDALERWTARGRVDFHFKLAQGGSTVDVSIDSNYFWERGGQLEWEQTDYYVNGNKVRWKNIPELPLVQPEKVITLPLDLTLDKTYEYRLVGEDRVRGREAYVLAFDPVDPDSSRSLYSGRLWVDKKTFQRLKASLIQSRLEPPVVANEERDVYLPHPGPDGSEFWMLSEVDGEQLWTAAGRNFVVRRELSFSTFEINPPREDFEKRRAAAYASQNQMLRDTDDGFRYLERQRDGTRTVKEGVDSSQLFAAAGLFEDSSRDLTPLAGVNYFNYDVGGKDIQLNVLFGGVLAFVTASKPAVLGGKADATIEATGVAIRFEGKRYVAANESVLERIEQRPQNLSLRLGFPLGKFFKLSLVGDVTHRDYAASDDASAAVDSFNERNTTSFVYRAPEDHIETAGALQLEFNRRGYSLTAGGVYASRSDWSEFGLFDGATGSFLDFDGGNVQDPSSYVPRSGPQARDSFVRYGASVSKEWYLPKFQKLRGEVNVLGGSDLDRFSLYEFTFFGDDRLNGFSGSGVQFDRALIGRLGYSFNLFEAIRLDAVVESARVEERRTGIGERSFTGLGLSGNVVGPWKTVISLSYGYALAADIDALEGEQEFLLLVFKLF